MMLQTSRQTLHTLLSSPSRIQRYGVCVCVCFLPIHSGHQVRWTYQPGSHKRKITQDFSSTFLRCVCVCFLPIHSGHKFVGRTSRGHTGGRSHRISRPPSFCCVCVCFLPVHSAHIFVGRTSRGHTRGRSQRISRPPSFCGACLYFSREKDSAIPFPRRPWSRILRTNDLELIVLRLLGILILIF